MTVKQIKMFYITSKVEEDSEKLNTFLKEQGEKVIDLQMSSWRIDGGDTLDSVMVIYEEEVS